MGKLAPDNYTICECKKYCGCGISPNGKIWSACKTRALRQVKELNDWLLQLVKDKPTGCKVK